VVERSFTFHRQSDVHVLTGPCRGESPAALRFRSAVSAEQPQPPQRQFTGIPGGR
jgi:hypothetical protein